MGHTAMFEKTDYMSIFPSGSTIPVTCGTLQNGGTKKKLWKSYFYPKWPLLENAQRKLVFKFPLEVSECTVHCNVNWQITQRFVHTFFLFFSI